MCKFLPQVSPVGNLITKSHFIHPVEVALQDEIIPKQRHNIPNSLAKIMEMLQLPLSLHWKKEIEKRTLAQFPLAPDVGFMLVANQ